MHKKIQIVFTCVLFFFFVDAFSQGHNWSSAGVIASSNDEVVTSINKMPNGYVVSGYVSGKVAGITDNQIYGGKDGFVAKYSSDSRLQWIFTIGTSSDDTIKTATGPDGSIYVYGTFKGVVNCGGRDSDLSIGSARDTGTYIIKFNANGNYQSHFESTGNLKIVDVQVSEGGKVVALGDFKGLVSLAGNIFKNLNNPYHTVYFALDENNLKNALWSQYCNPTSKELRFIDAVLGEGRLFMVAYSTGSSFGVFDPKNELSSFYSGKKNGDVFVLSSANLVDGSVNWFYTVGLPNNNSEISGLSYSNDNLFLQINTKDSLSLQGVDLVEDTVNTSNKSYTVKLDVSNSNQDITGLKEFRSSDSLNVVDIKALNGNVYLLASYKKNLRSTDFVLNANVETEVAVIKLDNNLDFWYAHKAKERGDFIEPVALDVFADDEYYMTGNFSKRVYLDTLSVEYLPSNSKKIFSAKAIGTPPKPVDQGDLIDDEYCFVKNATVQVELPVLENDLKHSDKNNIQVIQNPSIGSVQKPIKNGLIGYNFPTDTINYKTQLVYKSNGSENANVFIEVIDSTILAKDSSVCGRENFSVNLYDLYDYSVDTIEFRVKDTIVNSIPLDVPPIQVEIIKVNSLCEEKRTITLNKKVPPVLSMDTSIVSCSLVLDISNLYSKYGEPIQWSPDILSFNEVTKELTFSRKGAHSTVFERLNPVDCYVDQKSASIKIIPPESGEYTEIEVYPYYEIELYGEETPNGENRWEIISVKGQINDSTNQRALVQVENSPVEIRYISIDENGCVYELDTFSVSIKDFFIPNAFSPNDDGLNESFSIKGSEQVDNKKLKVYNTQGLLVYQSEDYQNDWKGIYQGEQLPEDIYYFEYDILDKKYTGYIEIKR